MNTLVIVESPGKIKKLSAIMGEQFTVMASVGHVRDLPNREMGVAPPTFQPHYVPTEKGKPTIAKLRQAASKADRVLLATDPDREGEAIAWHLADELGLRQPRRITFDEITDKAVKAALSAERDIDMDLVHAQEARRVLDRLVGYRVSPALSDKAGQPLTAGRVQSPALRLVVDREREIHDFQSVEHYGATLGFDGAAGRWCAEWQTAALLADGEKYMLDDALAVRVAEVRELTVTAFSDGVAKRAPAAPFITSTLQSQGGARLKLAPKVMMATAQSLYEQGLITYLRTDSPNLSDDALADIAAYAQRNNLKAVSTARTWKAKAGAQEAHEAIRPTHMDQPTAGQDATEKAVYELIWQRTLASQLADATYAVRTAELQATLDERTIDFKAKGRTLTDPGWMAVYADTDDDSDDDSKTDDLNPIPELIQGDTVTAIDGQLLTKKTKPPARFTQSSLVTALERLGIGRPATYASITDNLVSRGYVIEGQAGKSLLTPAPAGEAIRDALVGTFGFAEYEYTSNLEGGLDLLAAGQGTYQRVVAQVWEALDRELGELATTTVRVVDPNAITCPSCKAGQLHRIKGSKGFFWACTAFRDGCKHTVEDNRGKPLLGGADGPPACPTCKEGFLRRITGKNGPFWGCSRYADGCTASFPDKRNRPDTTPKKATDTTNAITCPECNVGVLRQRNGSAGVFWGCSHYPTCKKTYSDKEGSPSIPK